MPPEHDQINLSLCMLLLVLVQVLVMLLYDTRTISLSSAAMTSGRDFLVSIVVLFCIYLMHLAAPGLIGLRVDGSRGALVEVNSETDFVARNAKFQEFVEKALEVALEKIQAGGGAETAAEAPATRELDVQELLQAKHPGSQNGCWLLSRNVNRL